ncbi:Unknown protein sequence [Pseudomonas amygdali pv. lachrymans]|nr:Unknown protein sequence [Pseudomonas amygdali pv. lachrymans]
MSNLNNSIAQIDDVLVTALYEASHFALNDKHTVKREGEP